MEEQVVKGIVAKIPNGYFKPSGKKVITSTEEIDVNEFSKAQVVDNNLRPENIAKDVKVLGIVGTHEGGGGIDTSDATASANDLLLGKTAYVDGEKIVGKIQYYTNDKVKVYSYDGTTIATSGKYTPYDLRIELDASLIPSGSLSVTTNGTYDVTKFASVNINVAIPEGYLKPSGTFETSVEGTYNVSTYANATFSVQKEELNVTPSSDIQTLTPSANKFYNKVVVQPIPNEYVVPSGTLEVTENGEHDVATYEKVNVNVASSGEDMLQARIDINNSCEYLFYLYKGSSVDYIANLDTSSVTNMSSMFNGCSKLTTIPLLNTSSVTNMSSMFSSCSALTTIPLLNTGSVTNMSSMFYNCSKLVEIPALDTSKVTNMQQMFGDCSKLTKIPQLDTSKVTIISSMFKNCYALTSVPLLDTGNAINMQEMFSSCSALTSVSLLNTSKATNMSGLFKSCSALTSVSLLNTSKATNMSNMFMWCYALTSVPLLDTSSVTNMSQMFSTCYSLTKIDISYYNINSTSYSQSFVASCSRLKALVIRSFGENYILNANALANCFHFTGTIHETYNPNGDKDGYFYVPRNMIETLSSATNWSTYASQFRALEDYTLDGTTTGELDLAKMGLE